MKFQVLADDAAACNQLADNLRAALRKLNLDVPVEMDASPSLIAGGDIVGQNLEFHILRLLCFLTAKQIRQSTVPAALPDRFSTADQGWIKNRTQIRIYGHHPSRSRGT